MKRDATGRPLAYDITHLVTRLPMPQTSGIEKVDLAFARHFSQSACDVLVHYGHLKPKSFKPEALADLLRYAPVKSPRAGYAHVYSWLTGTPPSDEPPHSKPTTPIESGYWSRRLARLRWQMTPANTSLPKDAIYLNVAQHAFEFSQYFSWLKNRPDVFPVFLVHDL
ncbi:MAG: glycosyltransferase family 1 protein, partial [Proteobacteria bacterium]|nr:glycosyltransferase family 1 protein [Pseudomonadota bacterium]